MLEITDCLRIKFSMQRINLSFCGLTYFLVVSEMILERKKHFDHLKGLLMVKVHRYFFVTGSVLQNKPIFTRGLIILHYSIKINNYRRSHSFTFKVNNFGKKDHVFFRVVFVTLF